MDNTLLGTGNRRRIYLMRHGEVQYVKDDGNRVADVDLVDLTDYGRQQAAAMADVLRDVHFDRTLASLGPQPFVIGVGYPSQQIATIYPQAHDIPMDIIIIGKDRVLERTGLWPKRPARARRLEESRSRTRGRGLGLIRSQARCGAK